MNSKTDPGRVRAAVLAALTVAMMSAWAEAPDAVFAAQSTHRIERDSVLLNGRLRRFKVYVPANVVRGLPPVLAFHGSGGDGTRLRLMIGRRLDTLADTHGLVVIYPDAYLRAWNGCRSKAPSLANRLSVDDVAFVRQLLRWASTRYGTSAERAFALGYSSGGHLVYRLALEAPDLLAAGSVFAANLPASDALDCRPTSAPVALMIANGTADAINPYEGGQAVLPDGRRLGRVRSAMETARYFAALAGETGIAPASTHTRQRSGEQSRDERFGVDEHRWSGSTHQVILYTVHGGGHTIPGSNAALLPIEAGRVERRFDAIGETIGFFLDQHRRALDVRPASRH